MASGKPVGSYIHHTRKKEIKSLISDGSLESILERFFHIPSLDIYMRTRHSELWNQTDMVNVCGTILKERFKQTGDIDEISNAISAWQRAVQLTPDGHDDMPGGLNNLGNSFLRRFERTGDLTDIANAISAHQRAVQLTPDGHANMPNWLNSLGNSFFRRFERTGDLTDIADAISAHQRVVQLTPDGHAWMPSWLGNLGTSFLLRFERTGDLSDITNAISALQRAVQLIPDGHVEMPTVLSSLGRSFLRRFERTGDLTDIDNAISAHQRSVQLTPNGHPNMPILLGNLGDSFWHRFLRAGDFSATLAATSNYRQAATYNSGHPSVRLIAAARWAARLSISHNPIDSLNAYDVVVNLLSQIAGMHRTIEQRHSSLVDTSNLTATAASAAFALGEIAKALEWLEQGRCLVWSQLNQLRTPVDDLKTHNPLLADRFLHISRALESSGSRQESAPLIFNGTFSEKVGLEDEAHTHVMLAQDWEQLLEEIRRIPGFFNFLRPRQALDILAELPRDGPVILINVHERRCDALALIPNCNQPLHIPLDHFTYAQASRLRDRLRSYLSRRGCRMRDVDRGPREVKDPEATSEIHNILQDLWMCVAKPILDALAYSVSLMFMLKSRTNSYSFLITSLIRQIQLDFGGVLLGLLHSFPFMQLESTVTIFLHLGPVFPTTWYRRTLRPSAYFWKRSRRHQRGSDHHPQKSCS